MQVGDIIYKYIYKYIIILTCINYNIMSSREIARGLRDAASNSYAKKFDTREGAEKYIKDFNFKIVDKVENSNNDTKGAKRKRLESSNDSIGSVEDHIKKVLFICNIKKKKINLNILCLDKNSIQ